MKTRITLRHKQTILAQTFKLQKLVTTGAAIGEFLFTIFASLA